MSIYKTYRAKVNNSKTCELKYEADFIINSTASTMIHVLRNKEDKNAALTIDDKEGPDKATVFTFTEEDNNLNLLKGDYFTWKDKLFFVYENEYIVHDALYQKQKAYECNVKFIYKEIEYGGYFISSLLKFLDINLVKNLIIEDLEKPVLVIPKQDWIKHNVKIIINNITWKVLDYDIDTNVGIAYISLDRDFTTKQEDVIEKPEEDTLYAGVVNEYVTNFAYFLTSEEVEIVSKTSNKIKFIIPFGIYEIKITTKDELGQEISKIYKVVS